VRFSTPPTCSSPRKTKSRARKDEPADGEPAEAESPADTEVAGEDRGPWRGRERRNKNRDRGNGDKAGVEPDRRGRRALPNISEILKKGPEPCRYKVTKEPISTKGCRDHCSDLPPRPLPGVHAVRSKVA